jgi:hypothetical protein
MGSTEISMATRCVRTLGAAFLLLAGNAFTLGAQAVDTARAFESLRDFGQACARDAGALWGHSLCGPIALVVPDTRMILANDTVAERSFVPLGDAYLSVLPSGLPLANTSFGWANRQWAMVLMPALSGDRFDRLALLAHESLHREQSAIGISGADALNPHLDERDGRRLLRLELRALSAALVAPSDTAARRNAEDALLFRRLRRTLYPKADSTETALELAEGIAEYTGVATALLLFPDSIAHVARAIQAVEARPSFVRSFAYGTGPALGVLLDRFAGPSWRRAFIDSARVHHASLSDALGRAMHAAPVTARALAKTVDQRARRYGDAAIQGEETARATARTTRLAAYRARLVDGPVLELKQTRLQRSFNPNELIPLADLGTIYPTGTLSAEWGVLEVTDGALVSPDFQMVRVAAPDGGASSGADIKGPGWTLRLATGWILVPIAGQPGSLTVQRDKQP